MRQKGFRMWWLGAAALCAAAVGGAAPAAKAQATIAAIEGYSPDHPFASSANLIVQLLRRQCNLASERFVVGIASETTDNQALTKDLSNDLMTKFHSAFSRVDSIGVVNFSDVGALNDLDRLGLLNNPNAGDQKSNVGRADVVIRAIAAQGRRSLRVTLRATHVRKEGCDLQLGPFEIPERFLAEAFLTPDIVFQRVARRMWSETRDRKFYVYRDSDRSSFRDPQLTNHFANLARSSVTQTRDDNADIRGKNLLPGSGPDAASRPDTWVMEASLIPFGRGYRLQVEALMAEQNHVAEQALIEAEQLPSTRGANLPRQASIIRASTPQPPRSGGPQRVSRGSGDAANIVVSTTPTRVQDSVDDQSGEQRYAFTLFRESFVEFDVTRIGGKQVSFKPELFGANGMPVDSFPPGRARINLRRWRLPAGQYELRIAPEERGRHEFVLAFRSASVTSMLEFEPAGRLTRRFDDWFVGERQINNSRVCFAYTQAQSVSPTGWREQRPYIWMAINGDPKIQEIAHFIDDATRYDGAVRVGFEDQSGAVRGLNVVAVNGTLQPAVANARGDNVLDRESVRGYTQGSSIVIEGKAASGEPAQVRYSLYGYRSAINAASIACGRPDLAQDLVWRR